MVFEFLDKITGFHILVIGETYRAYEQNDGTVLLNDEKAGVSFWPKETYYQFKTRVISQ